MSQLQPDESVKNFLRKNLNNYSEIARLQGDASDRLYFRIYSEQGTFVLCYDNNLKGKPLESYPYYIIYKLLRANNINVPEIKKIDISSGHILMQDLGDLLLEEYLKGLPDGDILDIYKKIIGDLIRLQKIDIKSSNVTPPLFDSAKLMQEFNFFIEHAMEGYFAITIAQSKKNELQNDFLKITMKLDNRDLFVFNHRDFHSRNIMISGGIPYFIDFQDARMGLPQYDLVSLIRDSYIQLKEENFAVLKDHYYQLSKNEGLHAMSSEQFDYYFNLMAFQRNIKAAGSFGYLTHVKKKEYFSGYIKPTLDYIGVYALRDENIRRAWSIIEDLLPVVR